MTPTSRWIVIPDAHVPLIDRAAWRVVKMAIEQVRPTGFICLGDFGESESVSRWKWKRRHEPEIEYQLPDINEDVIVINDYLDDLDEALDKVGVKDKIFIEGNHDAWWNQFCESNPLMVDHPSPVGYGYRWKDIAQLQKRNYEYVPAGRVRKVGKLGFYHGHLYSGLTHARTHLLRMQCNLIYAHHHDYQVCYVTAVDKPRMAMSLGCLKSLRPEDNEWLNNRPINWAHMFAVVDFFDRGMFCVDPKLITGGYCSLWGNVINGNKTKLVSIG